MYDPDPIGIRHSLNDYATLFPVSFKLSTDNINFDWYSDQLRMQDPVVMRRKGKYRERCGRR